MSSKSLILCQAAPGEQATHSSATDRLGYWNTDAISNFVNGLGTVKDASMYGRPSFVDRLTDHELEILYAQSDLARRIVDELPEDALRGGWKVTDEDSGEEIKSPTRHKLRKKVLRAYKMARLKGFAALVMIPPGNVNLSTPMQDGDEIGSLLEVVGREEVSQAKWDTNPRSPTFGECIIYDVSPSEQGGGYFNARVHVSRMLVFEGADLPPVFEDANQGFPDSILQACWPSIRRFENVEQGIASVMDRFETATYSISGLAGTLAMDDGADLITRRMRLVQQTISMTNAVVLDADAGETYTRNYANLMNMDSIWDRMALSASKSAKMPMTQLFGQAPGGMASDDEAGKANWRKQIKVAQTEDLLPVFEQYYRHLNGGKSVKIVFDNTEEMTASQESDIAVKRATARQLYAQAQTARGPLLTDPRFIPMLKGENILREDFDPGTPEENMPQTISKAPAFSQPEPVGPLEREENETVAANPSGIANRAGTVAVRQADAGPPDRFEVPEGARDNARKALKWKEEHGDEVKGGTAVGWTRARQLADDGWVTRETLGRMAAFERHRKNSKLRPAFKGEPWTQAGYVAWLIWGGDEGVEWAQRELDRIEEQEDAWTT